MASNEFLSKAVQNKTMEPTGITETAKKVRPFQAFHIKEEQRNLVIGSSLVKNLVKDQTIPCDIGVHRYRGSTTVEKIKILKQYPETRMTSVVLQDGTNSILKEKDKNEEQLFSNYIDLIEAVDSKFKPDKLFLMQVPAIRQNTHQKAINRRIKNFNVKLTCYASKSGKSNIEVLPIHYTMTKLPN